MAPTLNVMSAGYRALWDRAVIRPTRRIAARQIANKMLAKKAVYDAIAAETGVPWFVIAPLHMRESSMDFSTHLHCGDPLTARTVHVPKGRPKTGSPPFTFKESAIDALTMAPHELHKVKRWSLERILFEMEKYNGWGYLRKINSPYLWSWTSEYTSGKYYADGKYRSDLVDPQPGCVAMLKALAEVDPAVAKALEDREDKPPPDAIDGVTSKERAARTGSIVVGAGAAGGETYQQVGTSTGIVQPDQATPVVPSLVAYGVIGIAIAVVLIATFLIAKKKALVLAKWVGA